jgi:hypothetical protein
LRGANSVTPIAPLCNASSSRSLPACSRFIAAKISALPSFDVARFRSAATMRSP